MPSESARRYDLLEPIAAGGMGEVYRGRVRGDHGFHKLVAVKRILPELAKDPQFVVRFVAEAKLAVSLSHANVVQVFDLCKTDEDLFLVMELVEGADLGQLMSRLAKTKEQPPVGIALYVAMEALKGLAYAHERGELDPTQRSIVHCDISPSNLLISYAGEVKVTDFGVAQVVNVLRRGERSSEVRGKLRYMAPEQLRADDLDGRTDLYSVGIVLHELLTMRPLFRTADSTLETHLVLREHVPTVLELKPELPPALAQLVARVLSLDPAARPQSAQAMLIELSQVAHEIGPPVTAPEVARWVRRLVPPPTRSDAVPELAGALRQVMRAADRQRRTASVPDHAAPIDEGPTSPDEAAWMRTTRDLSPPHTRTFVATGTVDGLVQWDPESSAPAASRWPRVALGVAALASLVLVAWARLSPHAAAAKPVVAAVASVVPAVAPVIAPQPVAAPVPETKPRVHAAPKLGWMNVYAEPWAQVTIDGKPAGTTPLVKLALAEGPHHVQLKNPHMKPWANVVRVSHGQTKLVTVDLQPSAP